MRVANVAGRLGLLVDRTGADRTMGDQAGSAERTVVVDVERASGGRFGADPAAIFARWNEFADWAAEVDVAAIESTASTELAVLVEDELENPVPKPGQIFAIGLNYATHAAESGLTVPEVPMVFTKFASSLTGPYGRIAIPDGEVDWEVELVVVIGSHAHRVSEADGWRYVAGLTIGQDVSERGRQLAGSPPQFSLAKSFPGFGPLGPVLVTPDELADRDDIELGCYLNGELVQRGRTSDLVFTVPQLVSYLSSITPLSPGDVIFTGTPAGVGMGRTPPRYLVPGDDLVTYVDGIGQMRHRIVAADPA